MRRKGLLLGLGALGLPLLSTFAVAVPNTAPSFHFPKLTIAKGVQFARSLCDSSLSPSTEEVARLRPIDLVSTYGQGLHCDKPSSDLVDGGCPPYKFRAGTMLDRVPGVSSPLSGLPVGVFVEPNGLIHGTVKALGVLQQSSFVICMEDACHSQPTCKQLRLNPVAETMDVKNLTSGQATLEDASGTPPPAAPPASPAGKGIPDMVSPARAASAGASPGATAAAITAAVAATAGVVYGAIKLADATKPGCVTADDLADTGAFERRGNDTACTIPPVPCERLTMQVCVDLTCSNGTYYYLFSDGARFGCGTVPFSDSFTYDPSFCNGAAARAAAHCVPMP